jgi:hypothetical protein
VFGGVQRRLTGNARSLCFSIPDRRNRSLISIILCVHVGVVRWTSAADHGLSLASDAREERSEPSDVRGCRRPSAPRCS